MAGGSFLRCQKLLWGVIFGIPKSRIFKLPPQQPLRTGTFFNSIHPEDREKVVKAFGKALVGEEPFNIEHRIVWPDGAVRLVHGKAEVSFDGGRPVRVLGTVQNITDNLQIKEI